MELTSKQQVVELIKKNNNILITTTENNKGDGVSSGIALAHILEKLGKDITVITAGESHKNLNFLPGYEKIQEEFSGLRDFIISLSLEKNRVEKVSYKIDNDKLHFFVSPEKDNFEAKDVSFSQGHFKFDLVIVLDSVDLESLGSLYDMNTDFFYSQPVVNIDHNSGNDYFGAVNLVDLTASSTAEILVSIIESLDPSLLDERVATCLLAGIISDTNSFQNSNTTPKSLTVTAQLIAAGANHDLVVKNLFKTKPFDMLKIWGKILSEIKTDEENKILWSEIRIDDLKNTESPKEIINGVLDEILSTAPGIKIYLLFLEKDNVLKVFIRTSRDIDAKNVSLLFGGVGRGQEGRFEVKDTNLLVARENILEKIKHHLSQNGPREN